MFVFIAAVLIAAVLLAERKKARGDGLSAEELERGGGANPGNSGSYGDSLKPHTSGQEWSNILVNRFGNYTQYGQNGGYMNTVACTDKYATTGLTGIWAAMNYQKFGLSSLPCGSRYLVTDPRTGRTTVVVITDGGGSEGLDIDDAGYRELFPSASQDGLVGGMTVRRLE